MKKLLISIGTTSAQKIKYLKEVLRDFKIKAEVVPVQVDSKISNQPKKTKEVKQGSINRAKEALKIKSDFSIGIEVGYNKNKGKYEMFCFVTIVDKNGYQKSSQSDKFLLPQYHQKILNENKYLGDNLDGYINKSKSPIKKHTDNVIRYREPFIKNALKKALIIYLIKEDF
jgi:non-canonical (house-cleaning) NTP pyrophosphatase